MKALLMTILIPLTVNTASTEDMPATQDYAKVMHVDAIQSLNGTWCFNTQVIHNDEGWDHYADTWQVTDANNQLLAKRVLAHPHDKEQPFTRSQCGITIDEQTLTVEVSAKCNVHGFGGDSVTLDMKKTSGKGFTIKKLTN